MTAFDRLVADVRACKVCAAHLPFPPRPIVQATPNARILIAGQAPGRRVQASGVMFDDPSGERLRDWMGIDHGVFYDSGLVAVLPMGFCYPGKGSGGDAPPRPECAPLWRQKLINAMPDVQLTLVIGQYAQAWHLGARRGQTLTETVKNWRAFAPGIMPLPHPSPRNNPWLAANPWFGADLLPELRRRVKALAG